jgi:hypothetical protein
MLTFPEGVCSINKSEPKARAAYTFAAPWLPISCALLLARSIAAKVSSSRSSLTVWDLSYDIGSNFAIALLSKVQTYASGG